MRTSKWFAVTTAAALLAGGMITSTSRAVDNNEAAARHPLGARLLERAREKLDLTDEQVRQIKAALKSEKGNLVGLMSRMRQARLELRGAIQSPDASEDSVRAAAAKVAAVQSDVAVERMKLFRQIRPILTEEQRARLHEMQSRLDGAVDRALQQHAGDEPGE